MATNLATKAREAGQLDLFMLASMSPHQRLTVIEKAAPLPPNDFGSIKGQEVAKRALEIALVGGHPILLAGPTGCGKTLLVHAARSIAAAENWDFGATEWTLPDDAAPAGDFALHVECSALSVADMTMPPPCESSAEVAQRVRAARAVIDAAGAGSWALDAPARKLLEDPAKVMRLSDQQQWTACDVAESIAALAGHTGTIARIHIAEALSYIRQLEPPQPAPEPEPAPEPDEDAPPHVRAWSEGLEIVEVDPKRLEFDGGDISRSYSCQSLGENGAIKSPFRFRGAEWVYCGGLWHNGRGQLQCYRIVPLEAFDGPSTTYREQDWAKAREHALGGYHGMRAKHGSREIVLQGPPVIFTNGQPAQEALL